MKDKIKYFSFYIATVWLKFCLGCIYHMYQRLKYLKISKRKNCKDFKP